MTFQPASKTLEKMSAKKIKALVDTGTTTGYSGDVADLMTWGSLFQTEAAAATKVWSWTHGKLEHRMPTPANRWYYLYLYLRGGLRPALRPSLTNCSPMCNPDITNLFQVLMNLKEYITSTG